MHVHPQGHPGGIDVKPRRFRVTPAELLFQRSRVKTRPQHPGANPFLRQIGGDIAPDRPPRRRSPPARYADSRGAASAAPAPYRPTVRAALSSCSTTAEARSGRTSRMRQPLSAAICVTAAKSAVRHWQRRVRRPVRRTSSNGISSCCISAQKPFQIQTAHRKGACQQREMRAFSFLSPLRPVGRASRSCPTPPARPDRSGTGTGFPR